MSSGVATWAPGLGRVASPDRSNSQASIAVHIGSGTQKNICGSAGSLTSSAVVSEVQPGNCETGLDYNVYVLVCNGSSIGNFVPEGTGVAGADGSSRG